MKKNKTHILSIEKDDNKKELEFEIKFQLSLTVEQRYKRMKKLFGKTTEKIIKSEHQKTSAIISRS